MATRPAAAGEEAAVGRCGGETRCGPPAAATISGDGVSPAASGVSQRVAARQQRGGGEGRGRAPAGSCSRQREDQPLDAGSMSGTCRAGKAAGWRA